MAGEYKTRQREQILAFLMQCGDRHLSAEEVAAHMKEQGNPVGKSTVYRYLDKLVEQGLVRKYYLQAGQGACYQYWEDGKSCREHFHLKCTGCGKLIHVECNYLDEVALHLLEHHGFSVDNTKTVLYGFCKECMEKRKGADVCQENG